MHDPRPASPSQWGKLYVPGTHASHRSPITRGRQLHCPLRGSQAACREPSAEQWQAGGGERVWAHGGTHLPSGPPARTLTGTGREAVEAGTTLLAGGARVAGAAAAQPACPTQLVQGTLGVAVASCKGHRVRPWALWVAFLTHPAPSQPSAHCGSQDSRGSQGGSGHNEGHQTQAGMGSDQPRHSPRAGSPQGCSHTLRSREAHKGPEAGRPGPRPMPIHAHWVTLLTLAEGEVEVARGTAVTCGPNKACPARALASVTVTVTIQHSRAGTLAGCREGWPLGQMGARLPVSTQVRGWGGAGLTLAARAVEPWGAELAVGALEVGFAHATSHPWVLPAGVALGPSSIAVTVWWGQEECPRCPTGPALPRENLPSPLTHSLTLPHCTCVRLKDSKNLRHFRKSVACGKIRAAACTCSWLFTT